MCGFPWKEVCPAWVALWEEAHTSSTMKMKCFQAPSCSPAVSPPSGFPATRGCSRHLCSVTECSRARDTLSYWASPGVWGAVWTSLPPSGVDSDVPLFFLKGSCWQGGDKSYSASRGQKPAPGLGRATPGRLPGLHLLGLPVGPRGRVLMPLLPKLLLQPLLFLLQVSGHVVKGGLVQTAKALVHASRACAGGTRVDAKWDSDAGHRGMPPLTAEPGGPARPSHNRESTGNHAVSVDFWRLLQGDSHEAHPLVATQLDLRLASKRTQTSAIPETPSPGGNSTGPAREAQACAHRHDLHLPAGVTSQLPQLPYPFVIFKVNSPSPCFLQDAPPPGEGPVSDASTRVPDSPAAGPFPVWPP